MIQRIHGKPIDIVQFKKPVLSDIGSHLDKIRSIVDYLAKNEKSIAQSSCYICASTLRKPLVKIHGFEYETCEDCGHVYTTRRYTDEAIRRFYETNTYWAEVTYANKSTCHYRRDNVARPKVEFAERYYAGSRGTWLDVGSGIGDIVSVALENGWRATGLELSETSVAFAKEIFNIDLRRQTMEEYRDQHPELASTVDVVSLIGVLEHVVDPMGLLRMANQMLKLGGVVMIQVPNARSVATMAQEAFPQNVFRHMSPIEHIMVFTESSLNRAIKNGGFEPLAYWYHGLDFYELLTNLVLTNPRVQGSRLYTALMENLNELQQVIDDQELSDRIIVCARKAHEV
jgi:2-polyprenyl-3-methyl-5-hydroxy-6-metoxy-1,4-benzoquinol methylase